MIPMVDLKSQYHKLKPEIDSLLDEVFESTAFILGPNVQKLEQEVASMLGVKHALSCASGTDALHLALRAAGIGPGESPPRLPLLRLPKPFAMSAPRRYLWILIHRPLILTRNW